MTAPCSTSFRRRDFGWRKGRGRVVAGGDAHERLCAEDQPLARNPWTRRAPVAVIDIMGSDGRQGRGDRATLPLFDLELPIVSVFMAALGLLC